MRESLKVWFCPIAGMSWWMFYLRCIWIVLQLVAVYCLAHQASPFFYQRF